jgi:CheY-like chemotaxis protein
MTAISPAIHSEPLPYLIDCHACGATFDALQAAWCRCIVKERTLLCGRCGQCFCRAEIDYKRTVWTSAPDALWERKQRSARDLASLRENHPPDTVAHPLVLVVDDDRDIRALAVHLVDSLGFGCIHASDGNDGLALARIYRPHLILTDALMPKMDGRELCRLIKADPELAGTKVVIMSSVYTSGRFKREALSHFKADEYVAKPVDANLILRFLGRETQPPAETATPDENAWVSPDENAWVPPAASPEIPQPLLSATAPPEKAIPVLAVEEPYLDAEEPHFDADIETPAEPRLKLTARELIRLRAIGLDADLAALADSIQSLRTVDLIALRIAGVPLDFIRAVDPELLGTFTASELITLHSSGCDAASVNILRRLELNAVDIVGLTGAGVPTPFIAEVAAAVGRPISAAELMRLYAAGIDPGYLQSLDSRSVDDWIRLSTLGVSPDFIAAASDALGETCSTDELLQLWLAGVDTALLRQGVSSKL